MLETLKLTKGVAFSNVPTVHVHGNKLNLPTVNIIICVAKKERKAKARNVSVKKESNVYNYNSFILFLPVKRYVTFISDLGKHVP